MIADAVNENSEIDNEVSAEFNEREIDAIEEEVQNMLQSEE